MLHDKYLSSYHFYEKHTIEISAPPSKIYSLICELDVSGSRIVRFLFALRGIPTSTARGIDGWKKMGFIVLEEQPNREIILGLIGQFWKSNGKIQKSTQEGFSSFNDTNFAKTTWNFEIIPIANNKTIVETETRIFCGAEPIRKKFAHYWFFIRPFSAIIRKEMLKIIKQKSETSTR